MHGNVRNVRKKNMKIKINKNLFWSGHFDEIKIWFFWLVLIWHIVAVFISFPLVIRQALVIINNLTRNSFDISFLCLKFLDASKLSSREICNDTLITIGFLQYENACKNSKILCRNFYTEYKVICKIENSNSKSEIC